MRRLLSLAALALLAACGSTDRDPMAESTIAVLCENEVKEQIRSPSTADFPNLMRLVEYDAGRSVATVDSHVDAENAFGATVRNRFDCRVERNATDDGWRVTVNLR